MQKNKPPYIVIDDDVLNNMICKITLEMALGAVQVETFSNAEIALEFIRTNYDDATDDVVTLILLDINMPIMSGWEFLDSFDEFSDSTKKQFRIYLLSSSVDDRDKEKAKQNKNVIDYLSKPLSKEMVKRIDIPVNRA
ncbi:MAG TPA: response regulator [Cyclobacteriaceae bacterium]|jgi:response regulator RpfG family c-di-GMP phosphodiesterase|nr:response regulator [Cyclobacteriaceae bacterium]